MKPSLKNFISKKKIKKSIFTKAIATKKTFMEARICEKKIKISIENQEETKLKKNEKMHYEQVELEEENV